MRDDCGMMNRNIDKRRELFDVQDAVNAEREELIKNTEKQLKQ